MTDMVLCEWVYWMDHLSEYIIFPYTMVVPSPLTTECIMSHLLVKAACDSQTRRDAATKVERCGSCLQVFS